MIYESSYWKDDLLKLAKKLELRLIQKRWSERSFYAVEKELFLGFYVIRKLIESNKVSESIKNKTYQLHEFPTKGRPESLFDRDAYDEFDFDNAKKTNVSIATLCNQFIHSFHFVPFIPDGKALIGFYICSDYKRKTGIYLITIFDVLDVYRQVGKNYPSSYTKKREQNGKVLTCIE
ncbi:hypothetical protein JYT23_01810 [Mariprofundus ferrooxydans]|nr:hypothetical protein [Mariprofundus ferrooxydans]